MNVIAWFQRIGLGWIWIDTIGRAWLVEWIVWVYVLYLLGHIGVFVSLHFACLHAKDEAGLGWTLDASETRKDERRCFRSFEGECLPLVLVDIEVSRLS